MSNDEKNDNNSDLDTSKIEYKRPNFFKKVWYSVTKFEKYPEMAAEGFPNALKYLSAIMSIFAVIISISITIQLYQMIEKGLNYLQNDFPNFSYKDGVLKVESDGPIKIESNNILGKVFIDTLTNNQEQVNQYTNSISNEEQGIIILKDKVIIKNLTTKGEMSYNYKDLFTSSNITEFNKQDIIEFTKTKEMLSVYLSFFLVIFIYSFIIYIISTLMDSLILSFLGYLTSLIAKIKMKFVAIYNMAVYALTLSIILNAAYIVINMFTGFRITYFQVMYTSVAYIYLVAAIFIIKSEFIKKQAELIKIIEEQKIHQKEYKEEQPKDNKPEEKDKEEDNNKKKKENDGKEPEGSNA